jgi:transcription elongation factor Elf1
MNDQPEPSPGWLNCTSCGRRVECPPDLIGKEETCPYCNARSVVAGAIPLPEEGAVAPGAIGAMVCAILGLAIMPLLGGIGAIVLARQARSELARFPDRYTGMDKANTAEVLGWIALAKDALLAVVLYLVWS